MAFNLKEMSIDYKKLLRMVPTERAAAAQSGLLNEMINALTPGQIVNLFPRYYREKLPDIGNVNRYSSGLDVALSGGTNLKYRNNNLDYPAGPTIDEMKTNLLKKGINVDNAYEDVGTGALEGDPRVKYMKAIPTDQLAELGFTRVHDENGKTLIKAIPTKSSQMSDQEISNLISGTNVATENAGEKQRAILREANRLGVDPADLATVISYETIGTFDPNIMGGKGGKYKGLIQFGPEEQAKYLKPGMTFDEQMVAVGNFLEDRGYKKWLKDNPNASLMEKRTALYSTINAGSPHEKYWGRSDNGRDNVMTHTQKMFSDDSKNREQATGLMKDSYKKVDGNATPEQIAAARKDMEAQEMSYNEKKLAKAVYENQNKYYDTATPIENASGYVHPVTGKMMHEGHGITSEFGYGRKRLHAGVDIYSTDPETGKLRVGMDAPVNAPIDGTITGIMKDRGLAGNFIIMKDSNGLEHRFLHTDRTPAINPETGEAWKIGEKVKQGQTITHITGSGTKFYQKVQELGDYQAAVDYFDRYGWGTVNKPHLHYEVRKDGKLLDPANVFPEYDVRTGSDPGKEKMLFSTEEERKAYYDKKTPPAPLRSAPVESNVQSTMTAPIPVVQPQDITPKPTPVQPSQQQIPQPQPTNRGAMRPPVQVPGQNPELFPDMTVGSNMSPPSQFRAFNNARLYDAQSTKLYNGHFA
jgi:murein DD-endopeptidase MepM/ murein hydrolase activator NlpD